MPATFVPLTLSCVCPGDPAAECTLDRLWVIGSGFCSCTLCGFHLDLPLSGANIVGNDTIETDLNVGDANSFGTVNYDFGRSLNITPGCAGAATISYLARWLCISGAGAEYVYGSPTVSGGAAQDDCVSGSTSVSAFVTPFGGSGITGHTAPLGCTQVGPATTVELITPVTLIKAPPGGGICLCASGGTTITDGSGNVLAEPVYFFQIVSGRLAGGLTLTAAGCIEGDADPTQPGTSSVVFRVTDTYSGESAEVECGFERQTCGSETAASAIGNVVR